MFAAATLRHAAGAASIASRTTPSVLLRSSRFANLQNLRPTLFPACSRPLYPKEAKMGLVTINQSIVEKLKKDGVIPDVIDEFTPSVFLQAEFPSGEEVQLGNTIKEKDTQKTPKITITPGKSSFEADGGTYTLCMTDPDAYSRDKPEVSEFCHWLVTGIKPRSGDVDLSEAKELIEFMGPAPPEKTGKHRYCLLFFKNGKEKLKKPEDRKKWGFDADPRIGARHYAEKYDLTLVGANFFFCQNEKQ